MLDRAARRAARRARCGSAARSAGSPPRTPGLYRDALGAVPPGGLPEAFLERSRSRSRGSPAATPAPTGRSPPASWPAATAWTSARCCASSSARASWSAASCARAAASASGATPRCCAGCGARRWPTLRKEVEPAEQRALAPLPARLAGRGLAHRRRGAGVDRLREMLVPLQGVALAPEVWERDVLPRRVGRLLAGVDRPALRGRRARVGRARARSAAAAAAWRSTSARTRAGSGPPPCKGEPPAEPLARGDPRAPRARRRASGPTCSWTSRTPSRSSCRRRSGTSSGPARSRTTPSPRCARRRLTLAPPGRARARPPLRAPPPAPRRAAGPGPLVAHRAAVRRRPAHGPRMRATGRAAAGALRHRDARDRAGRGHPRRLRRALRRAGEPGDARHRPARLLRGGPGRRAVRAARRAIERLRACATDEPRRRALVLAADRSGATPTARRFRGRSATTTRARRPARVPGAFVVTLDAEPVALRGARRQGPGGAARGRRGLAAARPGGAGRRGAPRARPAPGASSASTASRWSGSGVGELLIELGFQQGPRKLTLSA